LGFSWYYRTSEALTEEEIENCISVLKKFARENGLRYLELPQRAKQFGPKYLIYEGTYNTYKSVDVDPSTLRGIFVIFPKLSVSEPLDFVPNSQKCIAYASCKTFAREPENTLVEEMLGLLVQTTNGKFFATNDAFDLLGNPPEEWYTMIDEDLSLDWLTDNLTKNQWSFRTKAPLDTQEIEDSINELLRFAHERNFAYVMLPESLEQLREGNVAWMHIQGKGYSVAEGNDRGSKLINRDPRQLRGIVVRIDSKEFEFLPNGNGYIASGFFASDGKQAYNQVAEEMLQILYKTTHGKLYAYLDSKDERKIIGEVPEYYAKRKEAANGQREARREPTG